MSRPAVVRNCSHEIVLNIAPLFDCRGEGAAGYEAVFTSCQEVGLDFFTQLINQESHSLKLNEILTVIIFLKSHTLCKQFRMLSSNF